jgi:UDP-N-acetylmuramate: L-alanyl-gamma-D-glutamyl-meso-diaminopimelate ligase
MHIHILGICGTFMGGIAAIARSLGHQVTGSDRNVYPPMSTQLEQLGIAIAKRGELGQMEPAPDLVIIGNALSRGDADVEAVLNRRLPYTSGPAWLGDEVLRDKWVLAVAGTHGKTTTASMLAHILQRNNLNPGFLIGGVLPTFGASARVTDSPFFVIEADEYDTAFFDKRSKFVHYHPDTLAINNLEFDHADIFDSLADIQRQVHHVIRTVPGTGCVLIPHDCEALQAVVAQGCWSELQQLGPGCDWEALEQSTDGSEFSVAYRGVVEGKVRWSLMGEHNVANGLMAVAAAQHAGVPAAAGVVALADFAAPKRRMELLADANGIRVYDDFAHHPTAMATTLAGIRARVGTGTVFAVIEPGSNTMRKGVHNQTLVDSLESADQVFAFDNGGLQWSLQALSADAKQPWHCSSDIETLTEAILKELPGECHVVMMSNGSFGGLREHLVQRLQQQRGERTDVPGQ